jgi:ParB-like chromosome segregation protein Spo0J
VTRAEFAQREKTEMNKPEKILEAHPIAALFPMLEPDELAELATDIAENGLQVPIVLDSKGHILDGRNRYEACVMANVEPQFETFDGSEEEAKAYVLSINVHRRHLTKGQMAMLTAMIYPKPTLGGAKDRGSIAKALRVSGEIIRMARKVLRVLPADAEAVAAGTKALADAYGAALAVERQIARDAECLERLRANAPELLEKVKKEHVTLAQAMTLFEQEQNARQDEDHARSVELRQTLDLGYKVARSLSAQFAADCSALHNAKAIQDEARQRFGEDVAGQSLFTKEMLKGIEHTLALLKKGFGL